MNNILKDKVIESTLYIRSKVKFSPDIAVILGSGLGELASMLEDSTKIAYTDIPHFPKSTVVGHSGELIAGEFNGKKLICLNGRFHYYEGYTMETVTYPVRVFKKLGVNKIIITNAAGGINKTFKPGDLMIITDHINFMCSNPLIGPNDEYFGPRFPDMGNTYTPSLVDLAMVVAKECGILLRQGVYVAVSGPTYETPVEINMFRLLGGDAVGMSTVPESIVARHMGMDIFAISCIANVAADLSPVKLTHNDVIKTVGEAQEKLLEFISRFIERI